MWVLVYVFAFNVMPSTQMATGEWRMNPTVIFQEFTSQASCNAVRDSIAATLKDSVSFAQSMLGDLRASGITGNNVTLTFNVECFPK
jgi:hypothetical protein